MSELPRKYDSHDGKKDTSNDDSTKACNNKDTERQRKHPRSDGECSRHNLLNNSKQKDAPEVVPIRYFMNPKTYKHQKAQYDSIKKGMEFTGVINGSFPGGYLITIGVGNCPPLSGVAMFDDKQPAQTERNVNENVPLIPTKMGLSQENQNEKTNSLPKTRNPDKIPPPPGFDEIDSEMLSSHEVQTPYKPVDLKPVNPTGVLINQTNSVDKGKYISTEYYSAPTSRGIMIDPSLHRNFSSSALRITPPSSDQLATSSFPGKTPIDEGVLHHNQNTNITTAEQFARVNQLGPYSSSLQNTSQHVNPTGVPINQTNYVDKGKCISKEQYSTPASCGIMIDPSLHRNFSSSTLRITPPSDQLATSSFPGKTPAVEGVSHHNQNTNITTAEQFARVNRLGINSSSVNQNTSQHVLAKNIETRRVVQHQLGSHNQLGSGIMIDPSLHRNFSSSALRITPPSDQLATSSFPGKTPAAEGVSHHNQNTKITTAEQFARVNRLGINSSSVNQNTSQHVLSKNIETRRVVQHQLGSHNQLGFGIMTDPSLHRNFSTSALSITPPSHQVAASGFPGKTPIAEGVSHHNQNSNITTAEQFARVNNQLGPYSSSLNRNKSQQVLSQNIEARNFLHQLGSRNQVANTILATNPKDRLMRVPGNNILGEKGSGSDQRGNSSSPTSKKFKHMQGNN